MLNPDSRVRTYLLQEIYKNGMDNIIAKIDINLLRLKDTINIQFNKKSKVAAIYRYLSQKGSYNKYAIKFEDNLNYFIFIGYPVAEQLETALLIDELNYLVLEYGSYLICPTANRKHM